MDHIYLYVLLLFVITATGGIASAWLRIGSDSTMKYLLAFSGAFLLSITLLHLIPENVETFGHLTGVLVLAGFFLQQIIQRFTHGVEHGHIHTDGHHHVAILPVFIGLAVHAFSEGIPLGVQYLGDNVLPSLFFAVAMHKIPEAVLITSLVKANTQSNAKAIGASLFFALLTPLAAILSSLFISHSEVVAGVVAYCVPVVAGSFLHIATTIFFESGTRSHDMNWKKWLVVLIGVGAGLLTMWGEH